MSPPGRFLQRTGWAANGHGQLSGTPGNGASRPDSAGHHRQLQSALLLIETPLMSWVDRVDSNFLELDSACLHAHASWSTPPATTSFVGTHCDGTGRCGGVKL